jgi:hypothetical protein
MVMPFPSNPKGDSEFDSGSPKVSRLFVFNFSRRFQSAKAADWTIPAAFEACTGFLAALLAFAV